MDYLKLYLTCTFRINFDYPLPVDSSAIYLEGSAYEDYLSLDQSYACFNSGYIQNYGKLAVL